MNEKIRAREVRVIGDGGEQLGIMSLPQALAVARERNADLVEVAPTAAPPVCRILDYGKYKYELTKKEREARKHQKTVLLKEIRLRPKIDEHDVEFKTRQIQKFLTDGDKVKISVIFRGRELTHPQLGRALLEKMAGDLRSLAVVEKPPAIEGRNMTLILAPAAAAARPAKEDAPAAPQAPAGAVPAQRGGGAERAARGTGGPEKSAGKIVERKEA
ncbi:MAG: translation initiation factor IF-3 [Chloroflexi bacterium]|nr:translation initiation factor IF-3 [Chloroflexota bacterium]